MNQYSRESILSALDITYGKPGYYDSPEGKNPWEKIWGLTKYAIPTGIFFSTADAVLITQARNALEAANVLGYWMVPLIGLSTAFTSVTYIATNLRGKDDKLNYACGVLACGPVLHAWKRSTEFTFWGMGILMAAALLKKDAIESGYEILPKTSFIHGNYEYDFSMVSEEWPRRPI
ncbi:hypothetical protein PV327_002630 [Microctonus hyperodae]|uniref:NADH dehydrogenase [ubiquinone] 1 alpha subcomplex subunit 11 n=1 Tax=Microctonus hyperodae TaxID=165561 RepID=A0AA39KPK5_MICHY|nr:hypothetical protein PV327_002630 [Microctonus hyperodae]